MGSSDSEHQQECKRESAGWQMRSCHPSSAVLYETPVCVVASPRASRLFRNFVFIIVDDVFVFDRVLIVLKITDQTAVFSHSRNAIDSEDLFVTIGPMTMCRTKHLIFFWTRIHHGNFSVFRTSVKGEFVTNIILLLLQSQFVNVRELELKLC